MSPFGNVSSAATPSILIKPCRGISWIRWKWRVRINAIDYAEDIVYWCFENFDKVNIDAKKFDDWKCVIPIAEKMFYYESKVIENLPFRIQVFIKTDEDATAFKLMWL